MKANSRIILDLISDSDLWIALNSHVTDNPLEQYQETTVEEAVEKLTFVKLLLEASPGQLDLMSYERKTNITNILNHLIRHKNNSSQAIIQVEKIYDLVLESGIQLTSIGKKDITKELKSISDKQIQLDLQLAKIKDASTVLDHVVELKNKGTSLINDINDYLLKSKSHSETMEDRYDKTSSLYSQIDIFYRAIQENERTVEAKRLSIETFAENIDELKVRVDNYESRVETLLNTEDTLNILIEQAETALNLNSALGISAAFSSQYDKSNNSTLKWWIVGAASFYVIALLMTVWIVGGWGISNPDSWSSIVGRIVAVGITVTAATFCAGQFRRQKMLAEDYAYKAVLSKSIVAFTEEIKKRDDSKVAEYLQKVLTEIHKDPQRSRTKRANNLKLDSQAIIEKIIDKVPSGK